MPWNERAWRDGRADWDRLLDWLARGRRRMYQSAAAGDDALSALSDVGRLRRLLDEAELNAVRAARHQRRSWSEIAVRLGTTRQSAWERWHDVEEADGKDDRGEGSRQPRRTHYADVETVDTDVTVGERVTDVLVPNVIGLAWDAARRALQDVGLIAVGPDPDGPPLAALAWPDGVVTDQSPESGARVPPRSSVILWTERGGGSGVREPRRPGPAPRQARAMRDEPEATGAADLSDRARD